jgi:hypothetical protein
MHLRNCALGVVNLFVQDVCSAAIDVEGWIHRHSEVFDSAVLSKDFADVVFFDVSSQGLDDDLALISSCSQHLRPFLTFALLGTGEPSLGEGLRV